MRNAIISTLAALVIAAVPAFAADEAKNAKCCCDKDVGASTSTVTIKDGDKETTYKTCGDACKDKISKVAPAEATKAFAAHNKTEGAAKTGG